MELTATLNELADTTGLEAQGAANILAGTTGLSLVGALNVLAGNSYVNYLELQGVINQLAGTWGLGVNVLETILSSLNPDLFIFPDTDLYPGV